MLVACPELFIRKSVVLGLKPGPPALRQTFDPTAMLPGLINLHILYPSSAIWATLVAGGGSDEAARARVRGANAHPDRPWCIISHEGKDF